MTYVLTMFLVAVGALTILGLAVHLALNSESEYFEDDEPSAPSSPLEAITLIWDEEEQTLEIGVPEDADPVWVLWALNEAAGVYLQAVFTDE